MDTLGLVESRSIAVGAELADGMLKAAGVELVRAVTICSGRYMIYISGDRESVHTAVDFARQSGRALAGSFVISNVSSEVAAALHSARSAEKGEAVGIVECRTVSAGVAAADSAVKKSKVRILRLVTGQGINGKSYFVLSGDVAAVEEAVEAAKKHLGDRLVEAVVLPRPEQALVRALTGGKRGIE